MSDNHQFPGHELRAQRVALGLRRRDVFKAVRVPTHFVKALEDGDFEALPAPCYVAGFLRSYCELLGLPAERYIDTFRECSPFARHTPEPPVRERNKSNARKEAVIAWAAICAALLLGWVTYTAVVQPDREITEKRVQAETREIVPPPTPGDRPDTEF